MEKNIQAFLKVMDPDDHATGGGTASAIAGAMAAGLAAMVARLSIGKEGMEPAEFYDQINAELIGLSQQLFDGARLDSEAFEAVQQAFRLPKSTDEEKTSRRQAIQAAWQIATDIPLTNAVRCARVLQRARELQGRSNVNAASDLQCALYLARAGGLGCLENVAINLPMLRDELLQEKLSRQMQELRTELLVDGE